MAKTREEKIETMLNHIRNSWSEGRLLSYVLDNEEALFKYMSNDVLDQEYADRGFPEFDEEENG